MEHQQFEQLSGEEQRLWLWRIARHKSIDAYRRTSRRPSVSVELMLNDLFANEDQTPEYAALRGEEFSRLHAALQALEEGTPPLSATSGSALSSLLPRSGGSIGLEDIAWSPDGKDVSALTSNGVSIWDAQNGSLATHLSSVFLIDNVNSVRELWQPRGHLLATIECQDAACQTTQASLWDTTTWSVVKQYPDIYTLDWSPDGNQLALVSAARTRVIIVDALTGQQVKQMTAPPIHTITAVHWSPDSKYLSCVRSEKTGSGNKISYFEQILIWVA